MTGYRVVNLAMMIEELGEGETKRILSDFSCPLNPDVEFFISKKAIEFAKQGWKMLLIAALVMIGTFTCSAIIAQIVLSLTHVI